MKQVMKRKVRRVKRTNDVDSEISYKRDIGLAQRVDAALVSISWAIGDTDSRRPRLKGVLERQGREANSSRPK